MAIKGSKIMALLGLLFATASVAQASSFRTAYPGLYSTTSFKVSEISCSDDEIMTVIDANGQVAMSLCKKVYTQCLLYGSCAIEQADGTKTVLSHKAYNEVLQRQTFIVQEPGQCPYGMGTARTATGEMMLTCLDPYFSVAADINEHTAGDVLFFPILVGMELPTGEIHDGYVIVRDSGDSLKDSSFDRYDIFTGFESVYNPKNVFAKRGLDNYDRTFKYQVVTGKKAAEIRQNRNFPGLPAQLLRGQK
ncbi:MAG: hypothetical protein KF789_03070 [Bdellovibrionaceae bacterium]|nr:hypothetical protein [Pseudobdellovibrionaceae bacterium]